MAHEMGHYLLNHMWKLIITVALLIAISLALVAVGTPWLLARFGGRWGIEGMADPGVLPALTIVISFVFLLGTRHYEGHTDAKGALSYNMKLSERRAYAVRDFLVSKGVNGELLLAKGLGSTDLAEPDEPLSPVNRRVRIVTLDDK